MKKRIMATVLCMVMLMSVVPMMAAAQEEQVAKIRGVVTENAYMNIYGYKNIDAEEAETVVIDIVEANADLEVSSFLVGNSNAGELIGKSVIASVREVGNKWEIFEIEEDSERNDTFSIGLNQFESINSDRMFEYYQSEEAYRTSAASLEEDVAVVYNNVGGYRLDAVFGKIVPKGARSVDGGQITLIDNNDVKGYDVIFVELAESVVVDEAEEECVYFKNSTAISGIGMFEYYTSETERMVKVIKEGEEIAFSDLKEWDVLSVYAADEDANYIVAEVCDNVVEGVITGESSSLTSATGKKYKINDVYYDAAAGAYDVEGMYVGVGGEFYIDKYGKIAAFREEDEPVPSVECDYAYVMNVGFKKEDFAEYSTAIIQLVTADGLVNFNLKETGAKLNDYSVNADDNREKLKALEGKMIKKTLNSFGIITSIVTIDYDNATYGEMYPKAVVAEYDAEDNRFKGKFYMDKYSFVFFVNPYNKEESYLGSEKDLVDGKKYVVAGYYADKTADDNNIVIISEDVYVDFSEDETDWQFKILINDNAGNLNYYAALYDKNDRMLSVVSDVLLTDDVTTFSIPKHSDAAYAKIHVIDENLFFGAISKKIEF